jgi:hypothetical protein
MSNTKITNPVVTLETRGEPMTIGLDHTAEENSAKVAQTVVGWANDQEQPYGFDNVPRSNEGTPYDEEDGAAAFSRAIKRVFGMEPQGMNWGPNPPIMKQVQVQEFLYEAPFGSRLLESELLDTVQWPTSKIVEFLDAEVPEYTVPRHYSDAHREDFLEVMRGSLKIIGAPVRTIYVPWGAMRIPGLDGIDVIVTGVDGEDYNYEGNVFRLAILGKRKDRKKIDAIVEAVRVELQHRSIFKNRCFVYDKGNITFHDPFVATRPEELIFSESMNHVIENEVFSLFRNADEARIKDHSLLNSKIVAAGEPGTGKTEFTNWAAQEALRNGFTIAFMHPGTDEDLERFKTIIARQTPVVGVIEDLESYMPDTEALTKKQANEERSKLLARIDGGQTKGKEVMWILTTNFPELFLSAMARPGRTDTYLLFKPLDRSGFERLLKQKLGHLLGDDIDFDLLWENVKEMSSSFFSGFVKKAAKYTLGKGSDYRLTNTDMLAIVGVLGDQWEWYASLAEAERAAFQPTLAQAVDQVITPVLQREMANLSELVH